MAAESLDEGARAHEGRARAGQSAFEARTCSICYEEYGATYVMAPCCQRKLCDECPRKACEGSVFPDAVAGGAPARIVATGSKCPCCRA
eukprot:616075-Pyramimonas_sp.AAC.1